jgi:hypothetical protein
MEINTPASIERFQHVVIQTPLSPEQALALPEGIQIDRHKLSCCWRISGELPQERILIKVLRGSGTPIRNTTWPL